MTNLETVKETSFRDGLYSGHFCQSLFISDIWYRVSALHCFYLANTEPGCLNYYVVWEQPVPQQVAI